jgi:hypothetical protein
MFETLVQLLEKLVWMLEKFGLVVLKVSLDI